MSDKCGNNSVNIVPKCNETSCCVRCSVLLDVINVHLPSRVVPLKVFTVYAMLFSAEYVVAAVSSPPYDILLCPAV
jgi:hypothetical protein